MSGSIEWYRVMDRLDLELYADRLARHEARLRDEIAAARLRIAWRELEDRGRAQLTPCDAALLDAIGVFGVTNDGRDDRAFVVRRTSQLIALSRFQALVEREIDALRAAA